MKSGDDLELKAKQLAEFYAAYTKELLALSSQAEELIEKYRGITAKENKA
jgi:hypothetical protein